jgi:hypothetical protein
MKRALVSTVMAGAMLSGCSTESYTDPLLLDPLTEQQQKHIERSFDTVKDFWTGKGVILSNVTLNVLTGDETTTCSDGFGGETITAYEPSDHGVAYCRYSGEVILAQASVNVFKLLGNAKDLSLHTVMDIAVAHEIGHAVAIDTGMLDFSVESELTADCYAGAALAGINSPVLSQSQAFYESIGVGIPDTEHGAPTDRYAAFQSGVAGEDC